MTDHSSATTMQFRVGHVISRTFSAFFASIPSLIPVFLVAGVPLLLMGFLLPDDTMMPADGDDAAMMEAMGSIIWIVVLIIVFSVAGYCWLSAGVTYAVVSHLRGRRAGAVEILVQSLRAVPRLVLLSLVVMIAFILLAFINIIPFLGMLVFIVAIAWLYVVYWVTIPAAVVEQLGPFAALGRSAQLTKGRRWAVLGVMVLWFIVSWVVMLLFALVFGALGAAADGVGIGAIIGLVLTALVQVLMMGLGASVSAVGYHDLRVIKEGVGTEEIARVFD